MGKYKIRDSLIDYRRSANLTQKEMSEKLFLSRQTYARYESEKAPTPDLDTICRMAEVMEQPVDYLLFGKEAASDNPLKDLPKDLQLLCEMYFDLNIQNTSNFQLMCMFLKFLEAEQRRGGACTSTKSKKD